MKDKTKVKVSTFKLICSKMEKLNMEMLSFGFVTMAALKEPQLGCFTSLLLHWTSHWARVSLLHDVC